MFKNVKLSSCFLQNFLNIIVVEYGKFYSLDLDIHNTLLILLLFNNVA